MAWRSSPSPPTAGSSGWRTADRPTAIPTLPGSTGCGSRPRRAGTGVGRSLLEAVEGWARETGHGLIGLGVTTTNEAAIRLYSAAGYTDTGERHPLRDDTDLEIAVMGKPL